jgi:D-aminopeptidase
MLGMFNRLVATTVMVASAGALSAQTARPRAREIGLAPGVFAPGPLNAITDVAGVRVGHTTLVSGDDVRTGVTVILPHGGNLFQEKVPGAVFVGNAFGKLAGSTQVEELGTIETPIALTNTLAVGAAVEGLVRWTLDQPGNGDVRSVNALVGETNDGGLNDIRGLHVRPAHIASAIAAAREGAVEEGSVGAGTGTRAFGWKGGIGTSSRQLGARYAGYTVGVLVQSNFGGVLTMGGAPVGKELGRYSFARAEPGRQSSADVVTADDPGDGSCMIVVATDAPLDARDLKRLAARALFGLARTGSSYSNGSGDFAIAFSTVVGLRVRVTDSAAEPRTLLPAEGMSPLFQAALEATEEAVYNSLLKATTVKSRAATGEELPVARVKEILQKYRVIQ